MEISLLEEDLSAFVDLGTQPEVTRYATRADIRWRRRGIDYEASIEHGAEEARVGLPNGEVLSYPAFLASPFLADLRGLAAQILLLDGRNRARSKRAIGGRELYAYDWYVESRVCNPDAPDQQGIAASEMLRSIVEGPGVLDATQVVFLTAHAGQGKSSVLQRFNVAQARRYQQSRASSLSFYVDAQGRGLSQLNEAIALQLNDLQFLLPHAAVPVLVREGLLTLIVDGFDELIGSRGTFDDAFSSLTNFLELLRGGGKLVAAARSTYFTQEYESRAGTLGGGAFSGIAYEMAHHELVPWNAAEQDEFIGNVCRNLRMPDREVQVLRKGFERLRRVDDADVLGRPLFCRDVVTMLASGQAADLELSGTRHLVRAIADSILEREATEKILVERAAVVDQLLLRAYLEELAGEMWQLETRELDRQTATSLMELLVEQAGLKGEAAELVPSRAGFIALLADGRRPRSVEFEHEVFFSHFLAGSIATVIVEAPEATARAALSKAALEADGATEIIAELGRRDLDPGETLDRLALLGGGRHPREAQIRRNCGSLAAALLRSLDSLPRGLRFGCMAFVGEDLSNLALSEVQFDDVQFLRSDLRGTTLIGEVSGIVSMSEPLISNETLLELDGFDWRRDVVGLRVEDEDGAFRTIYDPTEIAPLLTRDGEPQPDGVESTHRFRVDDDLLFVVRRLCHAYERMNPVGSRHDRYADLFAAPSWRVVRDALLKNALISETHRETSGPAQQFYRKHFQPAELMAALVRAPQDPAIDQFWEDVSEAG